jgi:hypothetical protein
LGGSGDEFQRNRPLTGDLLLIASAGESGEKGGTENKAEQVSFGHRSPSLFG